MVRTATPKPQRKTANDSEIEIDEIDWRILDELRIDGRASFGAIGDKIGLSETATRNRVHRLTKASVCQITVTTDARRLGLKAIASLGINVDSPAQHIMEALAAIPEVSFLAKTLGSYDIMAELYCRNLDELSDVIENKVRQIDGVKSIHVNLITDVEKFIVNPMIMRENKS